MLRVLVKCLIYLIIQLLGCDFCFPNLKHAEQYFLLVVCHPCTDSEPDLGQEKVWKTLSNLMCILISLLPQMRNVKRTLIWGYT